MKKSFTRIGELYNNRLSCLSRGLLMVAYFGSEFIITEATVHSKLIPFDL